MPTTNNSPDEPQTHGATQSGPSTPTQTPAEHPDAQNALAWGGLGLSTAAVIAGAFLCLKGHDEAGIDLIKGGFWVGSIRLRK
ncbi:hypothetical protein [Streptomyces sp. 8L]|uniref:hypothetical protein n=1 Tax=Streptomyces sp. 8L TaxID=2877242 RepID=UPI001CD4ADCE|nr:hypothetical protein [Streptomyces sp. 8L]MCA1223218.1 hypothetical protein [Streptomyces sp. 8L]